MFRQLREACRIHFDLCWYLSDVMVPSYYQKRSEANTREDFLDFFKASKTVAPRLKLFRNFHFWGKLWGGGTRWRQNAYFSVFSAAGQQKCAFLRVSGRPKHHKHAKMRIFAALAGRKHVKMRNFVVPGVCFARRMVENT